MSRQAIKCLDSEPDGLFTIGKLFYDFIRGGFSLFIVDLSKSRKMHEFFEGILQIGNLSVNNFENEITLSNLDPVECTNADKFTSFIENINARFILQDNSYATFDQNNIEKVNELDSRIERVMRLSNFEPNVILYLLDSSDSLLNSHILSKVSVWHIPLPEEWDYDNEINKILDYYNTKIKPLRNKAFGQVHVHYGQENDPNPQTAPNLVFGLCSITETSNAVHTTSYFKRNTPIDIAELTE